MSEAKDLVTEVAEIIYGAPLDRTVDATTIKMHKDQAAKIVALVMVAMDGK